MPEKPPNILPEEVASLGYVPKGRTRKTECPLTRDEFVTSATAIRIRIGECPLIIPVKQYRTGSFGWYLATKMSIKIGDIDLPVQVNMSITAIGSKVAE